ncbi:MAG TPA: DUF6541 family protein, partial [Phototrophicaceae bacterium]|nr:DUF6541 family protein [Phototrophicaceae bacterium]
MSWWGAAPDALTLAALAVLPGALALRLLGVRGLAALAAAPPVTLAAVGVLTVLFAPLGVPWRMPAVLAGLAVMLGALLALTRAVPSLRRRDAGRLADGGSHPAVGEEGGAGRGSDPAVGEEGGAGRGSDP